MFGNEVTEKAGYIKAFAFCTFLWFTLTFIGVQVVTPDLGVAAIVFLAAGISCRLAMPESSWKDNAALGAVLGVGYYWKAAMFPIGLAFLVILFALSLFSTELVRRRLTLSLSTFLLVASPLVIAMSVRAGGPSFGEAGRLAYVWDVNGLKKYTGWTGDSPDRYGHAEHPPRKLMDHPLLLEFGDPVAGTFPLWYDPSYWYAGAKARFDWSQQLTEVQEALRFYKDMVVYPAVPFISGALGLVILVLAEGQRPAAPLLWLWQIVWPLAAMSVYALVHVERRFLGAFLVLFWVGIYGFVLLRVRRRVRMAGLLLAVVSVTVLAPLASRLVKAADSIALDIDHPRQPEYELEATALRNLGLQSGDHVAIVGDGFTAYYAHAAKLRVAAEIPDAAFWQLGAPELNSVKARLSEAGVRALVAFDRPTSPLQPDWKDVQISPTVRLSILSIPNH